MTKERVTKRQKDIARLLREKKSMAKSKLSIGERKKKQ